MARQRYTSYTKTHITLFKNNYKKNPSSSFTSLKVIGNKYHRQLEKYYQEYLNKYYELMNEIEKIRFSDNDVFSQLIKVANNNYSNLTADIINNNEGIDLTKYNQLLKEYDEIYEDLFNLMNDIMDFTEQVSMEMGNQEVLHQLGIFNSTGSQLFESFFFDEQAWSELRHNRDFMRINMSKVTKREEYIDSAGKTKYRTVYVTDEEGHQLYRASLDTRTDLTKDKAFAIIEQLSNGWKSQVNSDNMKQLYSSLRELGLTQGNQRKDGTFAKAKTGRLNEEMVRYTLEKGGIGEALSQYNELKGTNISLDNLAWYLTGDQNFKILLNNELYKINLSQKSMGFSERTNKISGYGFTAASMSSLLEVTDKMQKPQQLQQEYDDIINNSQYKEINTLNIDENWSFIKQAGGIDKAQHFVRFMAELFSNIPGLEVTETGTFDDDE